MKNILKVLALVCCVALFAVVFTGCKPPIEETETPTPAPSTDAPKTIAMNTGDTYRILIWSNTVENQWVDGTGGADAQEARDNWLDFQEEYGVTVTYVAAPGDWLGGTMASAASSEPICDIFHMGGPFTIPAIVGYGGLSAGTYLVALSEYAEYAEFSDAGYWNVSAQDAVGFYGGKQFLAIPNDTGWGSVALNQVCFFNKSLLAEGGHSAEEVYELYKNGEWTFDKMREIAIDCTNVDKGVYGLGVSENAMAMLAMIASNGGAVLTANSDGIAEFTADSQKSLTAINFFLKLAKDDKVVYTEGGVSVDEASLFKNGTTVMMLSYANRVEIGAGAETGAIYQEDGLKYGVVLPPKGPDATDYISDVNWFTPMSVLKGHANPAGVVQCLNIYMCPEVSVDSEKAMQKLEASCGARFQDDESIQSLKDAVSKAQSSSYMVYWSTAVGGVALANVTTYNLLSWISGESTPETDYAANKAALNDILKSAITVG